MLNIPNQRIDFLDVIFSVGLYLNLKVTNNLIYLITIFVL